MSAFQPREIVTYADLIEVAVRKAGALPYRRVQPVPAPMADPIQRRRRNDLRSCLTRTQGWRCFYCKCQMGPWGSGQKREATIDHVIPRARGGTDERSNLVAACKVCNEAKADMDVTAFIETLRLFETLARYPGGE